MKASPGLRRSVERAGQLVLLFAAYAASAKLAVLVAPEYPWSTLFWTPIGIGLAALTLGGAWLFPGVLASTFVLSWGLFGRPPAVAFFIALSHALACLAGALVLARIRNFRRSLERLRDVAAALLVAVVVTSALDAVGGSAALAVGNVVRPHGFGHVFGGWLAGGVDAVVVVAPVIMTWLARPPGRPGPAVLAEALALGASVLVLAALIFSQSPADAAADPLLQPYVLIFPLIWAAVRFGVRGSSAAALAVAVVASAGTYTGHGAFARPDRIDSLNALHVYLASTACVSLALGAVAFERVRSERELAAIVEGSADAIIGRSLEGMITSWNAAATRLFGYTAEEAIGQHVSLIYAPERREAIEALFARVNRGESLVDHDTLRRRKDERNVEVSAAWSPIRARTGALVGASVIMRDLGECAERWRLAAKAARLGMWYWNLGAGHIAWTDLCRDVHGVGPDEEVSYARWVAILHPDDRARAEETVTRAIENRDDYRIDYRVVWPDDSVHWLHAVGRYYTGDGAADEHPRLLGVVLDVTPQKKAERERSELLEREQAALAEARAATRAKDEFLAVVSHELRTPLQAILGWTALLRAGGEDRARVERGVAAIERNVKAQVQLVEDLLDVSRIVAGKLRVERLRVDLAKVVEAALDGARMAAQTKGVHLDAALAPDVGFVSGDPERLRQIVANLAGNAVKFTPAGGHVEVKLVRDRRAARIVVADDGCGIAKDMLPHVFERFRQADGGATRRHGGLGLGLAIVHHLVDEHGGTVYAESPGEGLGATFTVTLPLLGALAETGASKPYAESERSA